MLHEEIISCPVCNHKISVKVHVQGNNLTYLVSNECSNCKTPPEKIENLLNKSNKRGYVKTERSYIKLDPRG